MHDPGRSDGNATKVRTAGGGVHQLLPEVLREGVRILGPEGVLFVDRHVVRQEGTLGENEAANGLTGDVDESGHARANGRLDQVEGRYQVVREHDMSGVEFRGGYRGRVHDDVGAAGKGKGRSGVGEIGLQI